MKPALRIITSPAPKLAVDPSRMGYHVVYRGPETHCPGCGRRHWFIGRRSAECCFCGTAIDLEKP